MIKTPEEGGLNVPDIKSKIITQRIMLIKRLLNNSRHPWKEFPKLLLGRLGGINVLNSEIDLKVVKAKMSDFYYDTLPSWNTLQNHAVRTVSTQSLWCNKHIQIGGNSIYFTDLALTGINCVADMYNKTTGKLLTWVEAKRKTGLTDVSMLKWYGLLSALPKRWKHIPAVELETENVDLFMVNAKPVSEVTSKQIYRMLIDDTNVTITSQLYFNTRYTIEEEWADIYRKVITTTIETKLRSFQYKIVHNILYTNTRLFKAGLVASDLCTFCKSQKETVEHLFHGCSLVECLWQYCLDNFFRQFGVNRLTIEEKLFGLSVNTDCYLFLNHIILLTKWYIHKCRIVNVKIEIEGLKMLICNTRMLENSISAKRNKLQYHTQKWQFCDI
jgi:hypothetical protein